MDSVKLATPGLIERSLTGTNWKGISSSVSELLLDLGGDSAVTRPYQQNLWWYACVRAVSNALGEAPLKAYEVNKDGDEVEVNKEHPMAKLLAGPNPLMSGAKFWRMLTVNHQQEGETPILLYKRHIETNPKTGEKVAELRPVTKSGDKIEMPDEMWPVRATLAEPVVDSGSMLPTHWKVKMGSGNPKDIPAEAILHIADVNPYNPLRGQGPMTAALRTIAKDYQIDRFDDALLANGGSPGGVLSSDGPMTDMQLKQTREAWTEAQGRTEQHRKTAVLPNGMSYKQFGFSPQDMEFGNMREWGRDAIMAVTGVTKPILGLTEGVNFASANAAIRVFYETTVLTTMRFFEDEVAYKFTSRVNGGEDLVLRFDTSSIAALREDIASKIERTESLYRLGNLTFREAADLAGWDLQGVEFDGLDERFTDGLGVTAETNSDGSDSETEDDTNTGSDSTPSGGDPTKGENIQASALNGAQVSSLLSIVASVLDGSLPKETAISVLMLAFQLDQASATALLEHVEPGSMPDADPAELADAAKAMVYGTKSAELPTDALEPTRVAKWKAFEAFREPFEAKFEKRVKKSQRDYLLAVRKRLRDIATETRGGDIPGAVHKLIVTENELARLLAVNAEKFDTELWGTLEPIYIDSMESAALAAHAEVAGVGSVLTAADPKVLDFLATHNVLMVGASDTLKDATMKSIVATLAEAPASITTVQGAIAEQLAELDDSIDTLLKGTGTRARRIARTEIHASVNSSRLRQFRNDGITHTTWLTSRDGAVRDNPGANHMELEGRTRVIGDSFGFGLRFPGDSNASASNTINCRCDLLPEVPELEDE